MYLKKNSLAVVIYSIAFDYLCSKLFFFNSSLKTAFHQIAIFLKRANIPYQNCIIYPFKRLEIKPSNKRSRNRNRERNHFFSFLRAQNPLSATWRTALLNLDNAPPFFFLPHAGSRNLSRVNFMNKKTNAKRERRLREWTDSLESERIID